MDIGYYFAKAKSKLYRCHQPMIDYYRKKGITIGEHCLICSDISTKESMLISIGNNVTISTHVMFVTHDNSIKLVCSDASDLFGRIKIGNNSFIGQGSIVMYGVELADNTIVAAGSVVTKSFAESNIIIGGNPARVIGKWEGFRTKYSNQALQRNKVDLTAPDIDSYLVKR